jgi:fatty-acyl-CoA synthase
MGPAQLYPGAHVAERGTHPAVVLHETGESLTYAELDERANRFVHLLRSRGVGVGDHVALWCDNDLVYPVLLWGANYAGVHYTPISTRLTPDEVTYILQDAGTSVLVVSERLAREHADALGSAVPAGVQVVVTGDGPGALRELLEEQPADAERGTRVMGSPMLYSSGTSGRPKGVRRPITGDEVGTPLPLAALTGALFGLDAQAVYLSPAPLYHASPFGYVMAVTSLGGTAVLLQRFDAETALQAIAEHRVTHAQFVPTMFIRMLALDDETKARHDLSSLRCAIHAAAPCPVDVKRRMLEWWGPIVHEFYSGTEGVGLTYCSPEDWLAHPGTVGRPVLGSLHILDEDGRDLPPGQEGLIAFGGGPSFEYHNDKAKTAEAYVSGMATLGDVGRLDEDGFLYLTDRRSHLIITGGVNVYPQEAENVLASHPAVFDVAVIGVPHPEFGEEVKAVVQLPGGTEGTPELARALIAYCREQLADVKCPRSVDFRDELPREPNGKLLKRKLRDDYWRDRESQLV